MKKLFLVFVAMFALLPLFGQEVPIPGSIFEWFGALPVYLGSWAGLLVSLPFLVAMILGFLNMVDALKWKKYLVTGIIAAVLVLAAKLVSFGYLFEADWWFVPLNWAGLVLTEILGYALFKDALDKVAEKFNPWNT